MTDGSGTWVSRLCKSGEVLYYYNAVTGEWRWPSKNDDGNVPARKLCSDCVVKMEVDKDTLDHVDRSPQKDQTHVMAHFTSYNSGNQAANTHGDRVRVMIPRQCLTLSRVYKPNTSASSFCPHKLCQDSMACESKNDLASPSITNSDYCNVKASAENIASSEDDNCNQTQENGSNPQPYIYFGGGNHTSIQRMETQCTANGSTAETTLQIRNGESGTGADGANNISLSTGKLSERNNLSQPSRKHEQGTSTGSASTPILSNSFGKDPKKHSDISKELSFVNYLSHIKETYLSELPPSSSTKSHSKVNNKETSMECEGRDTGFTVNGEPVSESGVAPASISSVSNESSTCAKTPINLVPEVKSCSSNLLLRPPPGLRSKVTTILQSSPLAKSTLIPQVSANQSKNRAEDLNQNLWQGREAGYIAENNKTNVFIEGDARNSATLDVCPSQKPVASIEQQVIPMLTTEIESTVDKQSLNVDHTVPLTIKQSAQSNTNKIIGRFPNYAAASAGGNVSIDAYKKGQESTDLSPAQEALSFLNFLSEYKDKPELAPVKRQIVSGLVPVNNHLTKAPGVILQLHQQRSQCSPQLPQNNAVTGLSLRAGNSNIVSSPGTSSLRDDSRTSQILANVDKEKPTLVNQPIPRPAQFPGNRNTNPNTEVCDSFDVQLPVDETPSQSIDHMTQTGNDEQRNTELTEAANGRVFSKSNGGTSGTSSDTFRHRQVSEKRALSFLEYMILYKTQQDSKPNGVILQRDLSNSTVSSMNDVHKGEWVVSRGEEPKVSVNVDWSYDNPFSCPECGKRFKRRQRVLLHCRFKNCKKVHKCRYCDRTFKKSDRLRVHERCHTGEKPYKCQHCEKRFASRKNVRTHTRVHTGEKPYKCSHCSKSFGQKSSQLRHLLTHTGDKPFSCKQCKKTFNQSSSLARHERLHTGEKPYKCKQCDRTFTQSFGLVLHTRTHTGEKPHVCTQCNKAFSRHGDMLKHKAIHGQEGAKTKKKKCKTLGRKQLSRSESSQSSCESDFS